MNQIHPTTIIDKSAKIGKDNYFGPYCIVGPGVTIGDGNRFEAYVSLGTPAEHRDYFRAAPGAVKIGDNNVVREYVTINGGTKSATTLASSIVMLRGSHVGHDAMISNKCTLSCNVMIGGHTILEEGSNIGLSSVVHQFRVVGAFSMIGMNSTVTRHVPPFIIAFGTPCESHRVNRVGLQRAGVADADLQKFEEWFHDTRGLAEDLRAVKHGFNSYIESFKSAMSRLKTP